MKIVTIKILKNLAEQNFKSWCFENKQIAIRHSRYTKVRQFNFL